MKKNQHFASIVVILAFVLLACQREELRDLPTPVSANENPVTEASSAFIENSSMETKKGSSETCNPNAYTVLLESRTPVDGGWEWIWSVQNPNPGNGNNGTAQDLSHWGMTFGDCFIASSMVSAAYSGNGTDWTSFTPTYQPDGSQSCMSL